ncbi:MAG: hypothetical protein U9O94_09190 [Nanoarchaeota archaeon]|nr:hypothetical protein [Nanoarchaeota archaeon]
MIVTKTQMNYLLEVGKLWIDVEGAKNENRLHYYLLMVSGADRVELPDIECIIAYITKLYDPVLIERWRKKAIKEST